MGENTSITRTKLIDKTVFDSFNKLTNNSDDVRIKGAFNLIVFLDRNDDSEKAQKEKAYSLKRLIRGVGSTSTSSRTGFFTAFVAFLVHEKNNNGNLTITEIFSIAKNELSLSSKEEQAKSEVRIGKILVCGAVIRSNLIENATDTELETVLTVLKSGLHKMLVPLVFSFLNELVQKIESQKFTKIMWPIYEDVLKIDKEEHNMNTVHFLMIASTVHKKYVNKKFFESTWNSPAILHQKNYEFLAKLLCNIATTISVNHPFYEYFIDELLKSNKLEEFWNGGVEEIFKSADEWKHGDVAILRIVISIIGKIKDFDVLPVLLSQNFMKLLITKVKKYDQMSVDMRDLYTEFFDALNASSAKIESDECKLKIFDKLITCPSTILIEKYASNKIIQNLLTKMGIDGLKSVAATLKAIILNKNEAEVLNSERIYAAQTLEKIISCKSIAADKEWRVEQIKFFLNLGIFYSADGVTLLKGSKQSLAVAQELVPTMTSLFFHGLQFSMPKLKDEQHILLSLTEYVNSFLSKSGNKYLRTSLSDENLEMWKKMHASVTENSSKKNKKLDSVFHVLLMHMGFHFFKDPEVASNSINELESVMKRVQTKSSTKKNKAKLSSSGEPEWIEVVVDLFLNLMSQNSSLLRNVVRHVFPHLTEEITLTAFNQILSVVNLKDKTNPLSATDEVEEEEDEEEEGEEEEEDDEGGDVEEDESSEDEDEEELIEEEGDEEKVTDKMRMALQAALGNALPETDTESVDVDDMDEEEGNKLDAALSAAFKLLKSSRQATKPTKADIKIDVTLTHFRMRVLDLIDIYLKTNPNMMICLELMLYIFEMLPIAIKETKFKTILNRYLTIINNLIKVKQFNLTVEDGTPVNLAQILNDLMEKVAKGASFPDKNVYLLKACQFIIQCSKIIEMNDSSKNSNEVIKIFGQYLNNFLTQRNPPLSLNVFQTIFNMSWNGNWELLKVLSANGLTDDRRSLRKTQSLHLMVTLLKNKPFINADIKESSKQIKSMSSALTPYLGSKTLSQNEFSELMQLLLEINHFYQQNEGLKCSVDWEQIGESIQKLRTFNLNAQAMGHYKRLCGLLKLKAISNGDLEAKPTTNGHANDSGVEMTNGVNNEKGIKRKKKQSALSQKEKRLKKEERLKIASEGLEAMSFVPETEL